MKTTINHPALGQDLTDQPAIYVGTYTKYNNGSINGAWIDLTQIADIEDFWALCKELHSDEADPEFMFQDWQSIPDALIGESYLHENVFEYLQKLSDMDSDRREAFDDFCKNFSFDSSQIMDAFDDFEDAYRGQYRNMTEFAEQMLDDTGELLLIPEGLRYYFDFEAYAKDLEIGGDYWISSNGHVFSNY